MGGSVSGQRRECLMQSCALSMTKALQWLCRPGLNLSTFKSGAHHQALVDGIVPPGVAETKEQLPTPSPYPTYANWHQ